MLSFQPKAQGPHSASTARCPLRARTGATGNRDSQGPWAQWASLRANPGPSLHKSTHLPIPPPLPVPTTTFPSCTGQQSPADLCLLPTPPPPTPAPCCLPPSLPLGPGAAGHPAPPFWEVGLAPPGGRFGRREGDRPEDQAESRPSRGPQQPGNLPQTEVQAATLLP